VSVNHRQSANAAPQTLVANLTIVDGNPPCLWLREVNSLAASFDVAYSWSGEDPTASHSRSVTATVSGTLRRAFAPAPQVLFVGNLDQGQVKLSYDTQYRYGGTLRTQGEGAPLSSPGAERVLLWVDLSTCQMLMSASAVVPAQQVIGGSVSTIHAGPAVHVVHEQVSARRAIERTLLLDEHSNLEGDARSYFSAQGIYEQPSVATGKAYVYFKLMPQ
jgi:hypothetical protein